MADLSTLIRLHKHELDEKRQKLGELYAEHILLERARQKLEDDFEAEKRAVAETGDIGFTFTSYAETVNLRRAESDAALLDMQRRIDAAKEAMMESFSELKKFEMTQAERERLDAEAKAIKEAKMLDEIGLESFRRKEN